MSHHDQDDPPGGGKRKGRSGDYAIGYKRPPRGRPFEKGQSGNLSGRPKNSKNHSTIVREILTKKLKYREQGKLRSGTKLEAAYKQLSLQAAAGRLPAIREPIPLAARALGPLEPPASMREAPDHVDQGIMEGIVERLRARTAQADSTSGEGVADNSGEAGDAS